VLISCGARLAPFDVQEVRDLLAKDELELDTLGDEKTVLFVIVSDTNPTFVRPDRAFCNAEIRYCPA